MKAAYLKAEGDQCLNPLRRRRAHPVDGHLALDGGRSERGRQTDVKAHVDDEGRDTHFTPCADLSVVL